MAKCTKNPSIYADLEKCPGQKKLPGIRDWVFTTSKRDILSYPAVSEAPADLKEAAQAKGDFVLAADKYFYKIGIVKNNGKIEVENQGTDGAKTFLNKVTMAIPGTEEEATGLINQMNNDEIEIDLREIFSVLLSHLGIIILSGLVLGLVAIVGTKVFITPQYQSVTKMYVLAKQNNDTLTSADMQTSTLLTKDYAEMIQSRTVTEAVIAQLGLDMTHEHCQCGA